PGIQQTTVLVEGEVSRILREPANNSGGRILDFRDGVQRLVAGWGINSYSVVIFARPRGARQAVRVQVTLEIIRNVVSRTGIERRVGDRVIKRIREIYATVADQADVTPKLEGVLSMDPRLIIRD